MIFIEVEHHLDFVRCVGIDYMRVYDVPHMVLQFGVSVEWHSGIQYDEMVCRSVDNNYELLYDAISNRFRYRFMIHESKQQLITGAHGLSNGELSFL